MPAPTEIARLNRVIDELEEAVAANRRKPAMSSSDRRSLRADVESAIRRLDELRMTLSDKG